MCTSSQCRHDVPLFTAPVTSSRVLPSRSLPSHGVPWKVDRCEASWYQGFSDPRAGQEHTVCAYKQGDSTSTLVKKGGMFENNTHRETEDGVRAMEANTHTHTRDRETRTKLTQTHTK